MHCENSLWGSLQESPCQCAMPAALGIRRSKQVQQGDSRTPGISYSQVDVPVNIDPTGEICVGFSKPAS